MITIVRNFIAKTIRFVQTLLHNRSSNMQRISVEGKIRPTGRLEVMKIVPRFPAESEQGVISEENIAVLMRDDDVTAIRIADSTANSISANALEDGSIDYTIQGKSRQNEEGVEDVCRTLIERLNQDGSNWQDLKNIAQAGGREELGIDCLARDGKAILSIQVTRAETDKRVWKRLVQTGESSVTLSADDAATALHEAIRKKSSAIPPLERSSIILALDAPETPSYAFRPVLESFARQHGAWAQKLNFKGIWLVGPNVSLTIRLDG